MIPKRSEKIEQFKEMLLRTLVVESMDGDRVVIKGGLIDFGELGDCYINTARLVLTTLLERAFDTQDTITKLALTEDIGHMMLELEVKRKE